MAIMYSLGFFISGAILETIFYFIEKLIINSYSHRGKVRSRRLYQVPFEIVYWAKFPVVSALMYYTVTNLPDTFNFFQIIFYFSLFALGMFIMSEYFKDLKY